MIFPLLALAILQAGAKTDLGSASKPAPAPVGATVVATVNGANITAADVDSYLWDWRGKEALAELEELKLVEQGAKAADVSASKEEVLARLKTDLELVDQQRKVSQSSAKQPNVNAQESTINYLADQGFPLSRLYIRSEIEVLADKLALQKFDPKGFVEVATAVFRTKDQTAASVADAAERANNAAKDLSLGVKWTDILKATSAPDNIVSTGGLLGWREISIFPEEIRNDLPSMKAGSYSKPVQTAYGFQIFKVIAQGADAPAPELDQLKQEFVRSQSPAIIEGLRKAAHIQTFLK